jgi:hypothetical protein
MRIELDTLETSFNIFQNEPSTENLETIQSEWKELATTIQQATFLNLGPIQTKYGFLPINYWPVNSVKIEEVLESDQELNDEFMSTAGNSIKGVWALEDLLFDHGKTPEEMLKEFDGSKGNQRMAFARAQVDYLKGRTVVLEEMWAEYKPAFSANEGSGTSEPFSLLINRITSQLESIKNESLAKPMGLSLGGEPAPALTKGFESRSGMLMITSELTAAQLLFNSEKGKVSLAQLILSRGNDTDLSNRINKKFDEAREIAESFEIPLSKAVVDQPEKVRKLHAAVQDLVVLFKTEATSVLGVTITFNDMDGD